MASEGNSFLPRILSVFYAVFHDNKGTNIVYQVPEGLIATSPVVNTSTPTASSTTPAEKTDSLSVNSSIDRETRGPSRGSSSSRYSHLANSRDTLSSNKPNSTSSILFKFEDISRYVIPPSALCGRLVICATRKHQIIGFPVELYNEKRYERNYFRYNVCFVFDRTADLSCYEPIVRKVGRVLTSCEEESSFLTSPEKTPAIHAILEQLYEDLNSFSETSIPIDEFNSIELKIFPFYPNPPEVHDWSVPVALINLKKRIEDNWDLTMAKVCIHIDGTNHVSRIAYLVDCDLGLARKAIQHLLFYQVIMMIDIFQFSNMYTLCRSTAWLADELHVREECGPYVTRPDHEVSAWPHLLHLYSRLKPGITVYEWTQEYKTHEHGIDARRFVSFGVIKGFLRRVHRWPVLLKDMAQEREMGRERRTSSASLGGRRRVKSSSSTAPFIGPSSLPGTSIPPILANTSLNPLSISRNFANVDGERERDRQREGEHLRTLLSPAREPSTAERYLEQFCQEIDGLPAPAGGSGGSGNVATTGLVGIGIAPGNVPSLNTSPQTSRHPRAFPSIGIGVGTGAALVTDGTLQRRHSLIRPSGYTGSGLPIAGAGPGTAGEYATMNGESNGVVREMPIQQRPRLSRSPSSQATIPTGTAPGLAGPYASANASGGSGMTIAGAAGPGSFSIPSGLVEMLDGTHHTDEIGVCFELGWPVLEKYLVAIGGGRGDGDFGRVEIIYR